MIYDVAGTVDLISQTTATTRRDTTKTVTTKSAMIKTLHLLVTESAITLKMVGWMDE